MRKLLVLPVTGLLFACVYVATAAEKSASNQTALIEGAKKEGEVVVWTHTWEQDERLLKPFREKYPFINVKVWDSRNEEVVNRVITEAKAGRHSVDVLFLVNRGFLALKEAGLLQPYSWPAHVRNWPYQPDHKLWVYTVANPYVPAYNTQSVSSQEAPKSWEDLKNPKWRGKTSISSSGGEVPLLFAHLWSNDKKDLAWDKVFAFWSEVIKNTQPKVMRAYHQPTELLAAGEQHVFLLDALGVALRYMDKGAPIKVAPVGKVAGSGWGVAMPKVIPRPNSAKLLVDYLLSADGVARYADVNYTAALDAEVAKRTQVNRVIREAGIEVYPIPDSFVTNDNMRKATQWWTSALGLRAK
jgi:iron(III) transport system substrate-binding protein